jgi:SAM-dependent methyltransferase
MYSDEDLAGFITRDSAALAIQIAQTRFRRRIIEAWDIQPGSRVLEVGCGQGDLTLALADAVGPAGSVVAVDLAPADYGAPLRLGEATARISASPLGKRIEFRFEFDVRTETTTFRPDQFDIVAMAHSGWYFTDLGTLSETLAAVRPVASRLCFAEWDLVPTRMEQVPHLLSVLIHGQTRAFTPIARRTSARPSRGRSLESCWSRRGGRLRPSAISTRPVCRTADGKSRWRSDCRLRPRAQRRSLRSGRR